MGGNATFDGRSADRIVITDSASRDLYLDRIGSLFIEINEACKQRTGLYLWGRDASAENFVAGSTVHLFNEEIPSEELVKYKPSFGDIDFQIDKNKAVYLVSLLTTLASDLEEPIDGFELVGWSKPMETIVTIWRDLETETSYQVDFELVDFEFGLPSAWSKFSRSSDWEDVKVGIKGFAHKYIFRAMTAIDLQIACVQMKTKQRQTSITPWVFSPKGLRQKYRIIRPNVWEEIPTSDSEFICDTKAVFEHFFGDEPFAEELDWMNSFVGTVYLIHENIHKNNWNFIVRGMANLLWGKGAQGIVKGDYHEDLRVKLAAFNYLCEYLEILPTSDIHHLMVSYYMQAYK